METPREAIGRLAQVRGVSLSALSRMLGRNVAYLGQFVGRGSPRLLPERERALLAEFFGVEEGVLGAPPRPDDVAMLPYLDVAASAGPGALVTGERVLRAEPFARAALRAAGIAAADASLIRVAGDSMAPTLLDGDRLLVNRADRTVPRGGGVFVIRLDGSLAVKRVLFDGGALEVRSDNPAYERRRAPASAVTIIGRARLLLRDVA